MSLPKIHSLTDTDVKILLSLVQKQTLEELIRTSGESLTYVQKRMRHLQTKGFIAKVDKVGQAFVYQTCKLPETERLFDIRSRSNTNGSTYRIPYFYGQSLSFNEAWKWIATQNSDLKSFPLLNVIRWSMAVIKVRSYRKHLGETSQLPTEQRMREILSMYIAKTERELNLAKELRDTDYLWTGHKNIWQVISEGEPSDSSLKSYEQANKELTENGLLT